MRYGSLAETVSKLLLETSTPNRPALPLWSKQLDEEVRQTIGATCQTQESRGKEINRECSYSY